MASLAVGTPRAVGIPAAAAEIPLPAVAIHLRAVAIPLQALEILDWIPHPHLCDGDGSVVCTLRHPSRARKEVEGIDDPDPLEVEGGVLSSAIPFSVVRVVDSAARIAVEGRQEVGSGIFSSSSVPATVRAGSNLRFVVSVS